MGHEHTHHNHPIPANSPPEKLATCPVMHIPVNKEEAMAHGLTRTYKGQTYYLCCNTCTSKFDNDPKKYTKVEDKGRSSHDHHAEMMNEGNMNLWQQFKMSMSMTMGMDHTGLAGREMAKMMEIDIRNKFFFALIMSIPIILYSPLGEKILGASLPEPIGATWILLLLTTPVLFYAG